jgi:hypothetical protein
LQGLQSAAIIRIGSEFDQKYFGILPLNVFPLRSVVDGFSATVRTLLVRWGKVFCSSSQLVVDVKRLEREIVFHGKRKIESMLKWNKIRCKFMFERHQELPPGGLCPWSLILGQHTEAGS